MDGGEGRGGLAASGGGVERPKKAALADADRDDNEGERRSSDVCLIGDRGEMGDFGDRVGFFSGDLSRDGVDGPLVDALFTGLPLLKDFGLGSRLGRGFAAMFGLGLPGVGLSTTRFVGDGFGFRTGFAETGGGGLIGFGATTGFSTGSFSITLISSRRGNLK